MKTRLLTAFALFTSVVLLTLPLLAGITPATAQSTGTTERVSVASDGTQGNGRSYNSSILTDGRYVAFESSATNLVTGDTNGKIDIFVHDRQTGQTTRVSVASNGTQGDMDSYNPSISADGRYVAFESWAHNLVSGDTNGESDIFVYDRQTGQTTRVSVASNGAQGNEGSDNPSISANGHYVAFQSFANNLVSGDTNGWHDIFVYDRQTGQTTRISLASNGMQGNDPSDRPSISADGRYVAFDSYASNLVSGDTNGQGDVFVHDRQTGQTIRVSVASDGTQGNAGSVWPSISADGRYVAFYSFASTLVGGDTNSALDVFVHDRQTGQTTRVSVASDGTQGNEWSYEPSISTDGRYVAFNSNASNLVSGDTNGHFSDIFVHDRQTGQTNLVSVNSNGMQGNEQSYSPSISGNGRYVAFDSGASNLVSGDTNSVSDVFVHDRGSFAITHIEITQAIQDEANSMPLIAGKPTVVRVYVDCIIGCTPPPSVTGLLEVSGPAGRVSLDPINTSITAYHPDNGWTSQRGDLDKTLNFIVPRNLVTGTVTFTATVDGTSLSKIFLFQPAQTLRIAFVPINYQPTPSNDCTSSGQPTARIWQAFAWAQRVYPTAKIEVVQLRPPIDFKEPLRRGISALCEHDQPNGTKLFIELWNRNSLYSNPAPYVFGWLPDKAYWGGVAGGRIALGDDEPNDGQLIFAHETAHLLGRSHTKAGLPLPSPLNCENPTPKSDSDWPYDDAKIQAWGVDFDAVPRLKNPAGTYDYMSYCWASTSLGWPYNWNKPAWTSPHTYERIYYEKLNVQITGLATQPLSTPQPYFIASGLVYTDNTAILDPVWVITKTTPSENLPAGTSYCLEAQNTSATPLVSHCFDLTFVTLETGEATNVDGFSLMLPYPSRVARIVLKKGHQELIGRSVSSNAPVITVLSPNGGETWAATGTSTVTWTASDADGESLWYSVLYSPNGSDWVPVGMAITETQLSVDIAELAGGSGAKVRVLATDGVNTSADESDGPFTVGSKGPQPYILSPEEDGTIPPGTSLFLQGYAYDLEDGTLGESALRWTSSQDGDLGTGSQVLVILSEGQHVITLTATDSDGNVASDSINVFIGDKVYLPIIVKGYSP